MKNLAIVLRTFLPFSQKVLILDRKLGKLFIASNNNSNLLRLTNGCLFDYDLEIKNERNLINNVDVIRNFYIGNSVIKTNEQFNLNILFFHHILELYNFFIPIGFVYCQLFDLLYSIYDLLEEEYLTKKEQKLFLYKFFSLLGMCPINEKIYKKDSVNFEDEKFLEKWINICINSHPNVNLLKTRNFLTRINN